MDHSQKAHYRDDARARVDHQPPPDGRVTVEIASIGAADLRRVFSRSGEIQPAESTGAITLPRTQGSGVLVSQVWPRGEEGAPGANVTAFLYRIVLDDLRADEPGIGIASFSIEVGELYPLPYAGRGADLTEDVFVVAVGGPRDVAPASARVDDGWLTFAFDPPVRCAAPQAPGESSLWFGYGHLFGAAQHDARLVDTGGEQHLVSAQGTFGVIPSG